MSDDRVMDLQRGLEYYYESQKEFDRRGLTVEQQVAFGFEAGYQIGRAEALSEKALRIINRPMSMTGNFVSNGAIPSNYKMRSGCDG